MLIMQNNYHDTLTDQESLLNSMLAQTPFGPFFGISQKVFDQVWSNLSADEGNSAVYISMEIGADLDVFNPVRAYLRQKEITDSNNPLLHSFVKKFLHGPFKIPNYGGGLGVLAGDTLKSFAACKIPVAAISLLYRKGYFSQLVDSRIGQISWSMDWSPADTPGLYLLKNPNYQKNLSILKSPFLTSRTKRSWPMPRCG